MKNKFIVVLAFPLLLSSCTSADFRKSIGVDRPAPDEFMVQPRARLKVPEGSIALPTPQKQIDSSLLASQSGRDALYGAAPKENRPNTAAENAILAKANATSANPSIRREVEKEYKEKSGVFGTKRGGVLESILDPFGYNSPADPVVDAKAENKRIRESLMKGEKVDADKVKAYNPAKDTAKENGVL